MKNKNAQDTVRHPIMPIEPYKPIEPKEMIDSWTEIEVSREGWTIKQLTDSLPVDVLIDDIRFIGDASHGYDCDENHCLIQYNHPYENKHYINDLHQYEKALTKYQVAYEKYLKDFASYQTDMQNFQTVKEAENNQKTRSEITALKNKIKKLEDKIKEVK